jgi:hypothetical protein
MHLFCKEEGDADDCANIKFTCHVDGEIFIGGLGLFTSYFIKFSGSKVYFP